MTNISSPQSYIIVM